MEALNTKNQAADFIPSQCLNPVCSHKFFGHNPIFIGGGSRNITVTGTKISCPKCGHPAQMQDWEIDSGGRFELKELITKLRSVDNVAQLKEFKNQVEAANDTYTATELAEALEEIDPAFAKFKNYITSIPASSLKSFIHLLVTILTLVLTYSMWDLQSESVDVQGESVDIQREQLELDREKFEYSKQQDSSRLSELEAQMTALTKAFESEVQRNKPSLPQLPSIKDNINKGNLKGSQRNKPCLCGSGLKAKICHPRGLNFI